VGGTKYMYVQGVPGSIIRGVMKVVVQEETDEEPEVKVTHSLVAKKTRTGLVVGLFSDAGDLRKEPANSHIETVADALIEAGI